MLSQNEIVKLKKYRILHIGNIANNAFNSAQKERHLGLNSFVISPDYYHVMGFPVWETHSLVVEAKDHFEPRKFLGDIELPDWFLWGSWEGISEKLNYGEAHLLQNRLVQTKVKFFRALLKFLHFIRNECSPIFRKLFSLKMRHSLSKIIVNNFEAYLTPGKLDLFREGDILVFYGPYNYFVDEYEVEKKFVSIEHGTLREWIFMNEVRAMQSRKAYKKSHSVLITNQDCIKPAIKIGIHESKIIKTPHPSSDEDMITLRTLREQLIRHFESMGHDGPISILYPARHSYPINGDVGKGNEDFINALLAVCDKFPDIEVTMTEWGKDVELSKQLIATLGLEKNVKWSHVMSRKLLKEKMATTNLVVDQFRIDGYGAILADALGIGVPVVSRQNSTLDMEFFGCVPPILAANSTEEIVSQIIFAIEHLPLREHFEKSVTWYDNHLSSSIALSARLKAYMRIINDTESI